MQIKNLSKKQKAKIGSAVGGTVLAAALLLSVPLYKHKQHTPVQPQPAAHTVTESVTEPVTESTSEITTEESITEKVTKPPAAPVTKVYKSKKKPAPPPKKPATDSKKVILDVPIVKQNPKYPTGCEGASATMLLKYHGYNVTLDEMIAAIPRDDLYKENGKVYGPSIYEKFVGDPTKTYTDDRPGYGAFSPVITGALNSVISRKGKRHTAKNITGCSFNTLLSQLDKGRAVIVWATDNMKTPKYVNSWYIKQSDGSDKYFEYPRGTHVMVLSGYDGSYVYITDPYYGKVKYTYSAFNDKWVLLGKQAIVLESYVQSTDPSTEKPTESTTKKPTVSTPESTTASTTESTASTVTDSTTESATQIPIVSTEISDVFEETRP